MATKCREMNAKEREKKKKKSSVQKNRVQIQLGFKK